MGDYTVQLSIEMNSTQWKQNKTKIKQEQKKNGLTHMSSYQISTMVPPNTLWVMGWVSVAPSYRVKKKVVFMKPPLGSCPAQMFYSPAVNTFWSCSFLAEPCSSFCCSLFLCADPLLFPMPILIAFGP